MALPSIFSAETRVLSSAVSANSLRTSGEKTGKFHYTWVKNVSHLVYNQRRKSTCANAVFVATSGGPAAETDCRSAH